MLQRADCAGHCSLVDAGPQNPKGVYIHGGSCKYCQSVNHLQKDCPQHPKRRRKEQAQRQQDGGAFSQLDPEGFDSDNKRQRPNNLFNANNPNRRDKQGADQGANVAKRRKVINF